MRRVTHKQRTCLCKQQSKMGQGGCVTAHIWRRIYVGFAYIYFRLFACRFGEHLQRKHLPWKSTQKTQKHTQEQLLSTIVWEGRVIWRGFEISPAFANCFLSLLFLSVTFTVNIVKVLLSLWPCRFSDHREICSSVRLRAKKSKIF